MICFENAVSTNLQHTWLNIDGRIKTWWCCWPCVIKADSDHTSVHHTQYFKVFISFQTEAGFSAPWWLAWWHTALSGLWFSLKWSTDPPTAGHMHTLPYKRETDIMHVCVRIHRNALNMYTDCCKPTQDENMVIRSTLKHTCTHPRTRMHKHTHAPMNTRTNSCFQHAEAVWKTTSSQWVKHILFIYCSLKQASRALSLHTHVFCVCVCLCAHVGVCT